MEGAREVNGSLGDTGGAPHIKRKEGSSSPQSDNCRVMEPAGLFTSDESEWHENVSVMRSPEMAREAAKGKDLMRHVNLRADRANDTNGMVEELKLKNFRFPHLLQACSSNDGDEQVGKGLLWQNFYGLAGDPHDVAASQELESLDHGVGAENANASFSQLWNPNLLLQDRLGVDGSSRSCAPENVMKGENPSGLGNAPSKGAVRTKVLSAGFPQFLVKSNLKGKGVAYRCPGSFGIGGVQQQGHNDGQSPGGSTREMTPVAIQKSSARGNGVPPLIGSGGTEDIDTSDQKETSLRCWLRSTDYEAGKSDRLQVFRNVLELVTVSHSKGEALQHLRPSYLMLLPSNQAKYTGSFIPPKQVDPFEISNVQDVESPLKRRYSDPYRESHEYSPMKQKKVEEFQAAGGACNLFEATSGMNREMAAGLSSRFFHEQPSFREDPERGNIFAGGMPFPGFTCKRPVPEIVQLEEKWYASPEELCGSACSYESNIYSLGVLFFEIFCCFDSWEVRAAAMSDLRHRILPPIFLSESPKEAGFCLWLLHPEPSSRPKAREALLSDIFRDSERCMLDDQSLAYLEGEDAEADLLFHFLTSVKEEKEKQAQKLVKDIHCLRKDLEEIERRHSSRIAHLCSSKGSETSADQISERFIHERPLHAGTLSRSSTRSMNEARLMENIGQLEHAYFSMRSEVEMHEASAVERTDNDVLRSRDRLSSEQNDEGERCEHEADRLGSFFDGLCKFARYNRFEVCGSLRNGDFHNSANVICSLSFDRDEEYFAAAGVSKKIKIFEYESLLNDAVDIHYPAIEMSSRSRLSCVCWNSYIKNYLASTDYEGAVQLWDASTGQGFTQYTEHQKRAWSVDFSQVDPTKLASGSDDYSVKLWKINERNSTRTIRSVANVCCVQFSADSTNLLAFGSADYRIYCYDLRNVRVPWCTLVGHKKAVSYVRFLDSETLVSASTDNTLKLWDLNKTTSSGFSTNACSLTLSGHANEKNFIGLSVFDGYVACGSETNEVFAYYKSLPMPITSHKFGSIDPNSGQETGDDNGQFVSSVCWRGKSNMVVAANSSGSIKLLKMV